MKTLKNLLVVFLFASSYHYSFSQVISNFQKSELTYKILNLNSSNKFEENINNKINLPNQPASINNKSPYLGALFSGIIPGAGEFYAKSYIKAGIFFLIEVGLWTTYAIYQNKGNTQTDKFQSFADQNWSIYKYARWLKEQSFSGSDGIDLSASQNVIRQQINVCEAVNFSHQLPPFGEQQYYELIGKYQNFVPGWADADLNYVNRNNYITYKTDMFVNYAYDRQKANSYYDNASASLYVVILNHVLSAADAAWSVSMFNKDIRIKTGLQMENKYSYYGEKKLVPVANLNIIF